MKEVGENVWRIWKETQPHYKWNPDQPSPFDAMLKQDQWCADHIRNQREENIPDQKYEGDFWCVVHPKSNQCYTDDSRERENKKYRQAIRFFESSEESDHGLKFYTYT